MISRTGWRQNDVHATKVDVLIRKSLHFYSGKPLNAAWSLFNYNKIENGIANAINTAQSWRKIIGYISN